MNDWPQLPPAGPIEAGLLNDRNGRGPTQFEGWETWDESEEAKDAFNRGFAWAEKHPPQQNLATDDAARSQQTAPLLQPATSSPQLDVVEATPIDETMAIDNVQAAVRSAAWAATPNANRAPYWQGRCSYCEAPLDQNHARTCEWLEQTATL